MSSVSIVKLQAGDLSLFHEILRVLRDAFEMPEGTAAREETLLRTLATPGFCAYAAVLGGEVVGGMTTFTFPPYYHDQPNAYIYDVGVAKHKQRLGIGRQLVMHFVEECRAAGFDSVWVQAEGDDEDAIRFYQGIGAKGAQIMHFTFLE